MNMVSIFVCVGSACHLKGSYKIINQLQQLIEEKGLGKKVMVKAALCLGQCTSAVSVRINDEDVVSLSKETVEEFFEKHVLERVKEGEC